jgi:hypothetical protein
VNRSRKVSWARYVADMEEMRNILVKKKAGPLGILGCRWALKEIWHKDMAYIHVGQERKS